MRPARVSAAAAVLLALCGALLTFLLLRHIGYPLLWNDEQETAMFSERVLQYGYPKVNDGRNTVYMVGIPSRQYVDGATDAYIGTVWGHFYFGALPALLARPIEDLTVKTAVLRIPFVLAGLLGLLAFGRLGARTACRTQPSRWVFLALFLLLSALSVSLLLSLRQMRGYPVLLLLVAVAWGLHARERIIGPLRPWRYGVSLGLVLLLVLNTFLPAFVALVGTLGLVELTRLRKKRWREVLMALAPLVAASLMALPILAFFRIFSLSDEAIRFLHYTAETYRANVASVALYFVRYELLLPAVAVKLAAIALYIRSRRRPGPPSDGSVRRTLELSTLLALFFVVYGAIITRLPIPIIYTRYCIVMQPVLTLVLLLDACAILALVGAAARRPAFARAIAAVLLATVVAIGFGAGGERVRALSGYAREMRQPYEGPLDFIVPAIKRRFPETGKLTIATNYEEGAYMYYLGARTIVGYVGANIEQDALAVPDVVVFRKRAGFVNPRLFEDYLRRALYERIGLPVADYPVNNIPDLTVPGMPHLFETVLTDDPARQAEIWIRR